MSRKGRTGGGGSVCPKDETAIAVSRHSFRNTLVGNTCFARIVHAPVCLSGLGRALLVQTLYWGLHENLTPLHPGVPHSFFCFGYVIHGSRKEPFFTALPDIWQYCYSKFDYDLSYKIIQSKIHSKYYKTMRYRWTKKDCYTPKHTFCLSKKQEPLNYCD